MVGGWPTDYRSIQERIDDGDFSPYMHYPNRSSYHKGEDGLAAFRAAKETYRQQVQEGEDKFRDAALFDVGLENHPNAREIFDFAWSEGHSSGFYEVYTYLAEMSALFFYQGKMLNSHQEDDDNAIDT